MVTCNLTKIIKHNPKDMGSGHDDVDILRPRSFLRASTHMHSCMHAGAHNFLNNKIIAMICNICILKEKENTNFREPNKKG